MKAKLKPEPPGRRAARERINRLIRDLDDDDFKTREKAFDELAQRGESALPALRRALEENPSVEVRRRAEALLQKIQDPGPSPDLLRAPRTIEVLEHIGNPEARRILESLASGDPEAKLTQEAKEALKRLTKRSAVRP